MSCVSLTRYLTLWAKYIVRELNNSDIEPSVRIFIFKDIITDIKEKQQR